MGLSLCRHARAEEWFAKSSVEKAVKLRSILAVWGTMQSQVDSGMGQSVCHSLAAKAGHHIAWFEPDWQSWPLEKIVQVTP